jgi:hypothetical protein
MTLHLLKHPVSPLTAKLLTTQAASATSPTIVLLSDSSVVDQLPMLPIYQVGEPASGGGDRTISYEKLVELIFSADKVIAW